MRIAIVGAGVAGLCTARTLLRAGFEVTVYEQADDVGGVWSASRRYPGVQTQNDKRTYSYSDFPMPRHYPEWPSGQQVQHYLADYARTSGLDEHLRLGTQVLSAEVPATGSGWTVTSRRRGAAEVDVDAYDHLVVANGVFSVADVPAYPGAAQFAAAGGRVLAPGQLAGVEDARGRHVVVVGYGKSACDVAVPVSDVAASTTVVARALLWKMPRRLGGVLNYKYLMLTRLGEALFRYQQLHGVERVLHGPGDRVRRGLLQSMQAVVTRQLRLRQLGLVPTGTFEDIARSNVSLATDGFSERVADGSITVRRDRTVTRLLVEDGQPGVELSDGTRTRADLLVCATGFVQTVPFLAEDLQRRLTDDDGNFLLYRQIKPLDVPDLSFAGYNSSLFSPLSAEIAAVWITRDLLGRLSLPAAEEQRAAVVARLRWSQERTQGHHAHGTNVIPFSMHNIDEMLADVGVDVGRLRRALQWLLPVDPSAYREVTGLDRRRRDVLAPQG